MFRKFVGIKWWMKRPSNNLHFGGFESNEMEMRPVSNELIVMGVYQCSLSLFSLAFSLPTVAPCRSITAACRSAHMNSWFNLCFLAFGSSVFVASMRFIIACCASFAAVDVSILLAPLLRLRCLLPNLFTALLPLWLQLQPLQQL